MKRSLKNVVMLVFLLLLVIGNVCSIFYIKNNVNNTSMQGNGMLNMDASGGNNMGEPPEKPGDNNSSQPSGDIEENDSNQQMEEGENNNNQPPEMPGNDNMQQPNGMMQPGNGNSNSNSNSNLLVWHYVVFGIESLLIVAIVVYLVASGFNAKKFREVFKTKDKATIYILMVIVLTFCLTATDVGIANYLISNNTNNMTNEMGTNNAVSYLGAKEILEDTTLEEGTFESTKTDENAILVSGDIDVTLANITVNKTGDSNGGDNTSFYGMNSGILAKDGANLILKNITVSTAATGANGVFSYGGSATTNNSSSDGTTVTISDSKITTTGDNSGGIMTTGGGIMKASNLTIKTAGISSAAIRTDRGGGEVTVDGGTYTTTGQGSPAIYSTANVTVKNATLISKASEGIVIEGKNSVEIENVDLTDTNNKLNGQSTTYKNIFLYQSMSGDADEGVSTFTSKNSNITTNKGDSFYITNTSAQIKLENNVIKNNDSTGVFLRAQKDSWGTSGSNGGNVTLVLTNQDIEGNIVIDSISTLDMSMEEGSYYEGIINGDNSAKSIKLVLDKSSKIKLMGDSYVTSLDDEDTDYDNIDFNGYKLYVNGKAIN